MKLTFKLDTNDITQWFRPCFYCKYFSRSTHKDHYGYRECHSPGNVHTYFMRCYTNEGKRVPSSYEHNFRKRIYTRL